MKLLNLRKKIITNACISGALVIIIGLIVFYDSSKKKSIESEAQKVQSEAEEIRNKSSEMQNKIAEAKKYQETWKIISNNRKLIGNLKIDEVIAKINVIAEKYSVSKPAIKMTIPEDLNSVGIFNRSTVTVAVSTSNLTFEAVSDVKALAFITEFLDSMPGYAVVSNLEIRKTKKYTDQDLVAISSGSGSGAINVKVDFFWYLYRPKVSKSVPDVVMPDSTQPMQE